LIGSMEKGMQAVKPASPPRGTYQGVDLHALPKYICFKAASLKEKLTLKYLLAIAVILNIAQFGFNRVEISSLYEMLRKKDYILAFTTQGFVPVTPNMVPDSHVEHAVLQFLSLLGNVNPVNIDEQYATLASWMAAPLKARFLSEIEDWKYRVKKERISSVLTIGNREIVSNEKGQYKVTAIARRDTYVDNQFVGHGDLVIEMELNLVPPRPGQEWFVEMSKLSQYTKKTFLKKERLLIKKKTKKKAKKTK